MTKDQRIEAANIAYAGMIDAQTIGDLLDKGSLLRPIYRMLYDLMRISYLLLLEGIKADRKSRLAEKGAVQNGTSDCKDG